MSIKSLYQRFRAWQLKPFTFSRQSTGKNICANCGAEYEGDFCPECGQCYTDGPMDWDAAKEDLFSIVDSKRPESMFMFVVQLLLRPGYLISDYVCGRRKVCSVPMEKLGTIAIVTMLVVSLGKHSGSRVADVIIQQGGIWERLIMWQMENLNWGILLQTFLPFLPTWLLFHYSPRNSRHTFVTGLYIQVFMSSIMLMIIMLRAVVGDYALVLAPFYYYLAYRQMFGYGVWGTLWRTLLGMTVIIAFFGVIILVATRLTDEFWANISPWTFVGMFALHVALGAGALLIGYWISRRQSKLKK